MGPGEQFLFYAGDHGGHETPISFGQPIFINPSGSATFPFDIRPFVEDGMRDDPDNAPAIRIDLLPAGSNPSGNVEIIVDGIVIGVLDLPNDAGTRYVPIDEALIVPDDDGLVAPLGEAAPHTLEIQNNSNAALAIGQTAFFSGGIAQTIPIPEPGGVLFLIGCLVQLARR
jgi:hypothetical protein